MKENSIAERDVEEVIREKYDEIFPAERKAADFVLGHSEKAVTYNVSELAKASEVSDATIIRLCQHLGYSGYYQFRLALSRDVGKKKQQVDAVQSSGSRLEALFERYASSVSDVGRSLDMEVLMECVREIKNAGFIHLVSVGNTTSIAQYLAFRLERLGVRTTCGGMPETFMNHINLARAGDTILAITKSGASKKVLAALQMAKAKRLRTIVITAHIPSPAAELGDYVLECNSNDESRIYSEHKKGYSYLNEFITVETLIDILASEVGMLEQSSGQLEWLLAESKL